MGFHQNWRFANMVFGMVIGAAVLSAQTIPPPAQTPVPKPAPFPGAGQTPVTPPKPVATPTATPQEPPAGQSNLASIDARLASVPSYPNAEFLDSYDLGKAQRVFVFGTNDAYAGVVAFYKSQFRKSGEEVSRTPPVQQFDLASFDSNAMAQRPSVIVKDYTTPDPAGYLHVSGTTEKRFQTIIQIIPAGR